MNTKLDFPNPSQSERYRVDWMADLPAASVRRLREIGTRRLYQDGQLLQKRGDSAHHVLVLISGRLRSVGYTAGGTEQVTRWMEAGEVSGFSSVLGNAPVPVDLVATGDVEVLVLPRKPLLDFLSSDAIASLAVARVLSLRVNELFDMVFIRAEDALSARVWATLQRIAAENGTPQGDRTMLRISQGDLAHAVGASRQRVNGELRKLQAANRIRLGYRWLEILNRE
ncbi:cyclic nucleotide-binding domain-containing protein [Variovorax paradoxus]|uniref:Cyclic nucleotide-binding domain-containing protein n=1 Tax=Variovorax paradoxus TaxID=34073 RepID=A0A5Q0M8U4_VARPD|nr:Crp/Fnr family transcriptional regulator [Variovorax paradoxus]QFZ86210.1 cyclic nucleotide-binding domain-containing protein [Variovorax paradoxus]